MSHSDELADHEQQGRRFASALLDAGFDVQRVTDAALIPCLRLRDQDPAERFEIRTLLMPCFTLAFEFRLAAGRCAVLTGKWRHRANGYAFMAGVMSAIEAHTAGQS